jgi:hypothetical protein
MNKPLLPIQIEFLEWYICTYPKTLHKPIVIGTLERNWVFFTDKGLLNSIRDFHYSNFKKFKTKS